MRFLKFFVVILFVISGLFASNNLFAQAFKWEFGVEGGAGIRSARINPAYPLLDTKTGVSYVGGIAGAYNFNNMWALKLGAGYERKGTDFERTDISAKGKFNLDYLSIPLLVRAKFGKKVKFFVNAGPYLGILLNSKTKIDAYGGNPETEINNDSTTEKTDFGLSGGIGVEIPVGKSGAFTVEARDNLGMTNVSKSKETGAPEIKLNTANLMVGYTFQFGKHPVKKKM